jgi:FMN phosphatase YigB (HAD superfamily)
VFAGSSSVYAVESEVEVEVAGSFHGNDPLFEECIDPVGDQFVHALPYDIVNRAAGVGSVAVRRRRGPIITFRPVEVRTQRLAHRLALRGVEALEPLDEVVVRTERDLTHQLDIHDRLFQTSHVSDGCQPKPPTIIGPDTADSIKSAFADPPVVAVTFDLFGTLVDADRPDRPGEAVGAALSARGIAVPDDWASAFREAHIDAPQGAEVPLPAHVAAALRSRGVDAPGNAARRAVVAAFDPDIRTRPGAADAVAAAADRGAVGLLSNCSVPELVARTLIRSDLDREAFDATVTSVGCGWRKPHPKAFQAITEGLGVDPDAITHIGDDPAADGGITELGGVFVDIDDSGLQTIAERLRVGASPGGE